jgi:hypothetical protein
MALGTLSNLYTFGKTAKSLYDASPAHVGSMGTKDFGLTEMVSDVLGRPRTSQGGSSLFGSPSASSGQVQGLSDQTGGFSAATDKTFQSVQPKNDRDTSGGLSGLGGGGGSVGQGGMDEVFRDTGDAARQSHDAELSGLNTQYDRLRAETEGQLPFLQRERERGLSAITDQRAAMEKNIARQKEEAGQAGEDQIRQAGDIARQTQLQNRNILRSLGILSSSAAGELLTKPLNEFGNQRANIVQETQKRYNMLDDFMNEKSAEMSRAVESLEDNYGRLIGQVQNDLRFNERERADAIKAANAALTERMAEIKNMQVTYQSRINALKQNIATEAAALENWQSRVLEEQKITDLKIQPQETQTQRQQASILQPQRDEEEQGLSSLYA